MSDSDSPPADRLDDDGSSRATNASEGKAKRRSLVLWIGAIWFGGLGLIALSVWIWVGSMPNRSGQVRDLPVEVDLEETLSEHVRYFAETLGPRHMTYGGHGELEKGADYIRKFWTDLGYEVEEQEIEAYGKVARNLWITIPGRDPSLSQLVIGAHYDTEPSSETPGADDNASGTAVLLELTRTMKGRSLERTVQYVAFTNEEPPHFQRQTMGSWAFAKKLADEGVKVELMLSLESIGYYSDEPGSQRYPPFLRAAYPSEGNFVALVGKIRERGLISRVAGILIREVGVPFESAALPAFLEGVGWSDHWSFWQHGYPALMLTDTAIFRNPHYHQKTDTWDTLNYRMMAAIARGLPNALEELAQP